MKNLFFVLILMCGSVLQAQEAGLTGVKVVGEQGEPLIGATVKIMQGDNLITQLYTDFEGLGVVMLHPGMYEFEVSYTGYSKQLYTGVHVNSGWVNTVNITLETEGLICHWVWAHWPNLMSEDPGNTGTTLTSTQLMRSY